jgi:hypothetical protein
LRWADYIQLDDYSNEMGLLVLNEKHKVHEAKINITNQIDDIKEKLQLGNNYVNYSVLSQKIEIASTGGIKCNNLN